MLKTLFSRSEGNSYEPLKIGDKPFTFRIVFISAYYIKSLYYNCPIFFLKVFFLTNK
ncbi:hypothetical protein SAMN04487908_10426 [Aequorivita viscosa]|uniref:Uncharacterized protein n=1 Tax=Aequorivita viscosa TaxID=797419 RepID=A0A1M6CN33_9FLAO|nr:hypothetical protein SAMN04487908_10426 [Aequorivita viscosa]